MAGAGACRSLLRQLSALTARLVRHEDVAARLPQGLDDARPAPARAPRRSDGCLLGERYLGLSRHLRGADIVHSQELGYWYTMQAARAKRELGFKLVLTVWETLPLLDAYRNVRTRPDPALALAETDLFLAATERARQGAAAGKPRRGVAQTVSRRASTWGASRRRARRARCRRSSPRPGSSGRRVTRTCCAPWRCCAPGATPRHGS